MKKQLLFGLLAFLLIILQGCKGDTKDIDTVRIGFFPNVTHAQALYGRNTGAFEAAFGNIKVDWKEFNAGPSEIEAMFAGHLDIGYIGPIPAINAFLRSKGDIVIIAAATDGGSVLVARQGVQISSVKDLSGYKVAIPQLGNTQHLLLLNLLQANGLDVTTNGGTVEIAASSNADIMTLLDQGKVDAAIVPEPWGARMVNEAGAVLVLDEKAIWRDGDYPVALVIVNRAFMNKNPEMVKIFLETHARLTVDINAAPADAYGIINNELLRLTGKSLSDEVLHQAFSRINVTAKISRDAMDGYYTMLQNAGYISGKDGIDDLLHLNMLLQTQEN